MKAAVVTDFTQPLSIQDVPVPEPGDGQVLVRIEACGLCHTDIHAARGEWPVKPIEFTQSSNGRRWLRAKLDSWLDTLDPNTATSPAAPRRRIGEKIGGQRDA